MQQQAVDSHLHLALSKVLPDVFSQDILGILGLFQGFHCFGLLLCVTPYPTNYHQSLAVLIDRFFQLIIEYFQEYQFHRSRERDR